MTVSQATSNQGAVNPTIDHEATEGHGGHAYNQFPDTFIGSSHQRRISHEAGCNTTRSHYLPASLACDGELPVPPWMSISYRLPFSKGFS
jgi:hypothetical protein